MHIDEMNRVEFHTEFSEKDKAVLNLKVAGSEIELPVKNIRLSILKSVLIGGIKIFNDNKEKIEQLVLKSEGTIEIDGNLYNIFAVIEQDEDSVIILKGYIPEVNEYIEMRPYMPYDLIDFLTEMK